MLLLRAAWALPIASPPIRDAALLIWSDGRIAGLGPRASVSAPPGLAVHDLGSAVLLPGLVNVHTHLELTGFRPTAEELDFPEWILGIRRLKEARSPAEYLEAARTGLEECWRGGVTTIADTGDSGAVAQAVSELGGSGVVYQEVFGPHPDQCEESLSGLEARMGPLQRWATERLRLGVSPHAPYSVSGPLFARVASWADTNRLPLAVHVAESAAESELVRNGAGPFAAAWQRRGIPLLDDRAQQPSAPSPRRPGSSIDWLDTHGVLGPRTLCIHAVDLEPEDIERIRDNDAAVAHCPVSNARHGHRRAPLRALLDAGIRVGLGTDSVASVGKLDLFAEMRAARALGGLSSVETLALATRDGARVLGLERELGSLRVGSWGDAVAIRLEEGRDEDPVEAVLGSGPDQVVLTVLGGRIVHRKG